MLFQVQSARCGHFLSLGCALRSSLLYPFAHQDCFLLPTSLSSGVYFSSGATLHAQTRKKIIFVRELEFGFGIVRTSHLDKFAK